MKGCPFCGSSNVASSWDAQYVEELSHHVFCPNYLTRGPRTDTPEKAIVLWDQREGSTNVGLYNTDPLLYANHAYKELRVIDGHIHHKKAGFIARFEDNAAAIKCLLEAGYTLRTTGKVKNVYEV